MDPLCLRVQFSGTIHHHIPGPAALCVTLSVLWGREGRATPAIQPPRALLWTFNPLPPGCKTSWPPNSGPRGLKNLPDSFAPPFKWVPGWIKLSYLDSEKTKQNKKQKPEKMNLCPSVIYWHIFLKSIPFLEFLFFIFFLIRTENSRLSGRYLTTTLHATLWAGRAVCVQTDRSSLHILGEAAPLPPPLRQHGFQQVQWGWPVFHIFRSIPLHTVFAGQSLETEQIFLSSPFSCLNL